MIMVLILAGFIWTVMVEIIFMDIEKRLEIYKSEYYFQIDFKEKLYARMAIYAVLVTACITSNITMFDILITSSGYLLTFTIFLWELTILILLYLLYGFFCLSHIKLDSWTNTASDMENYRNILEAHFDKHTNLTESDTNYNSKKVEYINDEFLIYLVSQYSICSTIIRDNNIYRQRWLLKIMSCTYILLILTGVLGCIYLSSKV